MEAALAEVPLVHADKGTNKCYTVAVRLGGDYDAAEGQAPRS